MFRLYFQNGEFNCGAGNVWVDLIINAVGAFLGFLGAYILYLHSDNTSKKDTLKYAARLISSVIEYGSRQGDYCLKLAKEIPTSPWEIPLLRIEANSDLKRLAKRIDQGKFYHSYLYKYGRSNASYKEFANIYAKIDFLDLTIITHEKAEYRPYVVYIRDELRGFRTNRH